MAPDTPSVAITVPASAESARVLRAVVGSIAIGLDFTYDEIDDLRLALDEAFTQLLSAAPGVETVVVDLTSADGAIEVTASCGADVNPWPPSGARGELTWQVLTALTDQASFERARERPAIRFTKRPGPR